MGSSTTSETTTNTSTDSSNTVYTTVTVTDAEQEERIDSSLLDANMGVLEEKLKPEPSDARKEMQRRMEKRYETRRSREILNEFDELFLENEKRIRAEEQKNERKSRKSFQSQRLDRKKEEEDRRRGKYRPEYNTQRRELIEIPCWVTDNRQS